MEPDIRYCTTEDGVSIAYYTMGEGPPFVRTAGIPSHVSVEFTLPWFQALTSRYASECQIVRYDGRGTGLSQRVPDFSLETRVRDLATVVDHLQLGRFALLGDLHSSMPAIEYAARYPERVSHLVLSNPFAEGSKLYEASPVFAFMAALESVTREQWDSFLIANANRVLRDPEAAGAFAEFFKASMTPEDLLAYRDQNKQTSVVGRLGEVHVRTLVLGGDGDIVPRAMCQQVAAGIPGARFQELPQGFERRTEAILDFIRPPGAARPTVTPLEARTTAQTAGTAIILFADIVDSTALTERLGDAAFRGKARDLDASLRTIITEAGGAAIDGFLSGDGVLATFPAASQAIEAALRCGAAGSHAGLPLHLGIHAGDVIREANNVFGGAVNIASRISGLSAPGEVLVSRTVADLARTSAGVTFEDRGEHALKGIAEAVRVFAVRPGGA